MDSGVSHPAPSSASNAGHVASCFPLERRTNQTCSKETSYLSGKNRTSHRPNDTISTSTARFSYIFMVLNTRAASQAQQRADKPCLELSGQDRWMAGATGTCFVPNPTWTPICLLLQAGVRWKPALAARQHGGQSPCQAVPPGWVSIPHASQASTAWGLSPQPKGMIYKITHTHMYIYIPLFFQGLEEGFISGGEEGISFPLPISA